MKKRLFLYTILIVSVGLLCFFAASVYVTGANNLNFAKDTVAETAQIYADLYTESIDLKAVNNTRITVIAADGTVLADTRPLDVATLENHINRPEVQAALAGKPKAEVRYSDTLHTDLIYYALKVPSGDDYVFIRAAIPVAQIDSYLWRSIPILVFVFALVILATLFFANRMAKKIISPLDVVHKNLQLLVAGKTISDPLTNSYEEISQITYEIDSVARLLGQNIENLQNEKVKLDYVLDNIDNGLIAVDESENIALVNAAALRIFGAVTDIFGKKLSYLTFDKTLAVAVSDCKDNGQSALFELRISGSIFLVTIKRLPDTKLIMIVLSDVTENRENQKRREEFFANASHELKTPLTAIKGFNELTTINNSNESLHKYLDGIARETERMLSLIADMLKVSELENTQSLNCVSVSLSKVVDEVQGTLSATILDKNITLKIIGDAEISAEQSHVYELMKNLIENAVRYNSQGGSINVLIANEKNAIRLTVSDTGIGISSTEQVRIFERFYRIEKSRSQQGGGTGLGLSIVKHICALYGWKLSLKSKVGIGTEVTVVFIKSDG